MLNKYIYINTNNKTTHTMQVSLEQEMGNWEQVCFYVYMSLCIG